MSHSADVAALAFLGLTLVAWQDARVTAAELESLARGEDSVAVRVADVEIRRSDVFREMDLAVPGLAAEVMGQMTLAVVARLEALQRGVDVPEVLLEEKLKEAMSEQKARFALETDIGLSLEEYLARRHGWDADDHRREMRRRVLGTMLLDRLVRLDQITMDRDELAVLLVEDEALARRLATDLAAGASFSVLAQRHSVHPSARYGGSLPPMPADADSPLLEGRAGLEPGEILGPAPITIGDRSYWRILRLVDRLAGKAASWEDVREEIEAGLAARPVHPDEVVVFEARMGDRYRVTRPKGPP